MQNSISSAAVASWERHERGQSDALPADLCHASRPQLLFWGEPPLAVQRHRIRGKGCGMQLASSKGPFPGIGKAWQGMAWPLWATQSGPPLESGLNCRQKSRKDTVGEPRHRDPGALSQGHLDPVGRRSSAARAPLAQISSPDIMSAACPVSSRWRAPTSGSSFRAPCPERQPHITKCSLAT